MVMQAVGSPPRSALHGPSSALRPSEGPSAHPSMFLTTVKSRINARIRRNSNIHFTLYIDRSCIDFGFVRHIFNDPTHG